jgi:hypothetical protein
VTAWNDRATDQDFLPEHETAAPVEVRQVPWPKPPVYLGPVGLLPEIDAQLVRRTQ